MNYLSQNELIENLSILLDNEVSVTSDSPIDILPSEEEIYQQIVDSGEQSQAQRFQLQQPLAVVWDEPGGTRYWCIGLYQGEAEDSKHLIDHLESKPFGEHVNYYVLLSRGTP